MTEILSTKERQEVIRKLISSEPISDQKQLVVLLKKHFKIDTNQAVVSRDLRKMGALKKERNGEMIYELPAHDVKTEILKLAIVDVVHNESLIVIKVHAGLAAFVGDFLDECTDLDVLGCLAGENVVFVTPKTIRDIKKVYHDICHAVQFLKNRNKDKGNN